MTADPGADSVWLARSITGGAVLDHVSSSGTAQEIPLPTTTPLGGASKTKLSPDGSVWVSDDYRVFRYSPESGQVTVLKLGEVVPGESPAAQDPDAPLRGTWVSALTFDAKGDAILARHNVPALFTISPELKVLSTTPMAEADAGPSELSLSGSSLVGYAAGPPAGPRRSFDAGPLNGPKLDVNPMQGSAGDFTQNFTDGPGESSARVVSSRLGERLEWQAGDGPVSRIALPLVEGVDVLAPDGSHTVKSGGWPNVSALLPTADGRLWFISDAGGYGLYLLDPA